VRTSVEAALDRALELDDEQVYVAGGGQIYRAAWPRLDALEVTEVHQEPAGDITFPAIDPRVWQESAREDHDGFSYVRYLRR
jgi:dihydrofolate reductase